MNPDPSTAETNEPANERIENENDREAEAIPMTFESWDFDRPSQTLSLAPVCGWNLRTYAPGR